MDCLAYVFFNFTQYLKRFENFYRSFLKPIGVTKMIQSAGLDPGTGSGS
jgi:hypothetical protein